MQKVRDLNQWRASLKYSRGAVKYLIIIPKVSVWTHSMKNCTYIFHPRKFLGKKTWFVGVDPTLRCPIYGHHSWTLIPSAISSYIHCICHFNLLILNYIFRYSIRRAIIYKKMTKKILLRRELKTLKSVIDKRTQLLVPT